ncbi:hypothetical protein GOB94_01365 [Granulicella sp. 5B5]|uniref:hypothetical protein n=1 Tax=Granulicella sp. 5B5 TaxID=1617967 RepID=UPI0015F53385|nr:hypothetical protein [Granulicella sp. 5B5]QMV17506.1 hypothetical protein GOB94_01365 [Granulicella sp. 5B5]
MDTASLMDALSPAESYLQQIESLTSEIETAFDAIALNDISLLNRSIIRQEFMAAGLMVKLRSMADVNSGAALFGGDNRDSVVAAAKRLRIASIKYHSLLKHSSRSVELLASLCRSHSGQFKEDCGSRAKRQTWFCEM